jgi:hypothetical protein
VSGSSVLEILDALAVQLAHELGVDDGAQLQVVGRRIFNPTPPAIDVYPGDPFGEQVSFGWENRELLFTVRARVSTADHDAGQESLLELMDRNGTGSVIGAVEADRTLGGVVDDSLVEGPSGFNLYADVVGGSELLGCEWRLRCTV